MARKRVTLWCDPEGDFLEVLFERKAGYFREISSSHVMEKVDAHGLCWGSRCCVSARSNAHRSTWPSHNPRSDVTENV